MASVAPGRVLALLLVAMKIKGEQPKPRRALMFLRTLSSMGLINAQPKEVRKDPAIIHHVLENCEVKRVSSKPSRAELESWIEESAKSFVLISPDENLKVLRLLGPNGYFLLLTDVGRRRAEEYDHMIDELSFIQSWEWEREELGRAWASGLENESTDRRYYQWW